MSRAIDVCELESLLDRSAEELSGGERQRVALARVVDEPMASLDVGLRTRILPYLSRIRDEFDLPLLYITHDPDEAILLGDEIAVLDDGQLIAQGPPQETLWSQAVHSLASGLGVENVLEVSPHAEPAAIHGMSQRVVSSQGLVLETPWPLEAGTSLTIGLRAEDILISLDHPSRISARNVIAGRVARIDFQHGDALVVVDAQRERLIAKLTSRAVSDLSLTSGSKVYLIIKSQALRRLR
jgi:molybdate transport system ATP-binding protein